LTAALAAQTGDSASLAAQKVDLAEEAGALRPATAKRLGPDGE
jgi:hypothetical protein